MRSQNCWQPPYSPSIWSDLDNLDIVEKLKGIQNLGRHRNFNISFSSLKYSHYKVDLLLFLSKLQKLIFEEKKFKNFYGGPNSIHKV